MFAFFKRRRPDPQAEMVAALDTDRLPTFPAASMEVLSQLRSPQCDLSAVGSLLAADPALTIKLLKMVNSAAFGLRRKITSVQQAALLLGRNRLESLVLATGVGAAMPDTSIDMAGFWHTSVFRALLAKNLAKHLHPQTEYVSFTAALLADLAVPLLADHRGQEYQTLLAEFARGHGEARRSLDELEECTFGWTHAAVAGWVCQAWEFPTELAQAIAHHHGPIGPESPCPVAVALVSDVRAADDGEALSAVERVAEEHFGISSEMLADVHSLALDEAISLSTTLTQ